MSSTLIFEVLKLIAQLAGAAVVARLAVGWALKRYKSERMWDRRLAAYADLVDALSEIYRLNSRWLDHWEGQRGPTEEESARQNQRYREATKILNQTISTGKLILPTETQKLLENFTDARHSDPQADYGDLLHDEMVRAKQLIAELIEHGRKNLGIDILDRGG
ncbi:hypothetical protein [Alteraurantiacibacter palmitatis]|uniref:Uncharacterized protein n=1 Tax=Alteraurantiacibacter palmitatis TaxID=2054628 RepID=A0ABV7E6H8_9SPHN